MIDEDMRSIPWRRFLKWRYSNMGFKKLSTGITTVGKSLLYYVEYFAFYDRSTIQALSG